MPMLEGDLKGMLNKDEHIAHFQTDKRYLAEMLSLSINLNSVHRIRDDSLYHITGEHLDLKPANVLVDDHGRLYLSDFGVSKLMCPTADQDQ